MATLWLLITSTGDTGGSGASTTSTATEAPAREKVAIHRWEQSAPVLRRRIVDHTTGDYIDTDNVVDAVLNVYDLDSDTPHTAINTTPLSWEEILYSTTQLDAGWDEDSEGFNFKHQLWPDLLDKGGHAYRVEYTISMLGLDPLIPEYDITRVWIVHARSRFSA